MTVTTGGRVSRSSSSSASSSASRSMLNELEQLALLVLGRDDLDLVAELGAEHLEGLLVERLRRRGHLTEVEQHGDERCRVGVDLVGEVGQRRATAHADDRLAVAAGDADATERRGLHLLELLALRALGLAASHWTTAAAAEGTSRRATTAATTAGTAAEATTTGAAGGATGATAEATAAAPRRHPGHHGRGHRPGAGPDGRRCCAPASCRGWDADHRDAGRHRVHRDDRRRRHRDAGRRREHRDAARPGHPGRPDAAADAACPGWG